MSDDAHVYGGPDPKHDEPSPMGGFRGEGTVTGDRSDLRRTTVLGGGQRVEIEEESGVAYAESQGAGRGPKGSSAGS